MEFYFVLAAASIVIACLACVIWWLSRSISFPVGILFLYYWTLYGAWSIVAPERSSEKQQTYLQEKMFPIKLDNDYLATLILYALFIIIVELTILALLHRPGQAPPVHRRLRISHGILLLLVGAAGALSFLIVADQLSAARQLGVSGYLMTRGVLTAASPLYTIHQILLRAALIPIALGLAVFASGAEARFVVGRRHFLTLAVYGAELVLLFIFCLAIGNRHELFVASIAGVLLYIANAPRPRLLLLVIVVIVMVAGVQVIEFARGLAIEAIRENVNAKVVLAALGAVISGTERFAAHFSLYGVLHYEVSLTYGSSITSFLASAVPRLVWPGRPPGIYVHYAASVGATEGQGYTIHHATGWYLNFGVIGILAGAVLFGWVWVTCFNRLRNFSRQSLLGRAFTAVAPWTFTSAIPTLVRGGPEGYKGLIVESFLIPTVALIIAAIRWSNLLVTPRVIARPSMPERRLL